VTSEVNTVSGAVEDEEQAMSEEYRDPEPAAPRSDEERRRRLLERQGRRKSVALAIVLSMMPGLGQVYVGYYQRGFLHIFAFAGLIMLVSSNHFQGLEPFFGVSLAFLVLYNFVDAGRRAVLYNLALDGVGPDRLPDEGEGARGSLAGGTILIVIGVLLFLNLRFDVSLEWLEEWWPVGLIALGAYLVWQSRKERRAD